MALSSGMPFLAAWEAAGSTIGLPVALEVIRALKRAQQASNRKVTTLCYAGISALAFIVPGWESVILFQSHVGTAAPGRPGRAKHGRSC